MDEQPTGDDFLKWHEEKLENNNNLHPFGMSTYLMWAIVAYFRQTVSAQMEGNTNLAWTYAVDAKCCAEKLSGLIEATFEAQDKGGYVKDHARKAAAARHAKDHEIAETIQKWYADNDTKYKSMDAAAEAVSAIVGGSFDRARKHIKTAKNQATLKTKT
ncbi:hypothetical protein ETQ85_00650 [Zoogloea oleivorans]|uniref:Uncharacterized protein n=1 Tax=Zoogloea oleivorans TaxID=1552750 RepID=A0A6C2D8T2_9RHOO|nr:hypothetical protein ETQ85_00650 [Zoogloea oleivorans]